MPMVTKRQITVPLLLLFAACSSDDAGSLYTSSDSAATLTVGNEGTTSSPGDGDPSGDGDGDGDEDTTTTSSSTGPKLDVFDGDEMSTAGDGGTGDGCKKVDFLFVIDNSGSMIEEQNNLKASFPSFINSIMTTLDDAQDYHVMVIDTDAWVYASCDLLCAFPLPGLCHGYTCGPPATEPMECEDVLGAGVTHPRGSTDASNKDCEFATGKRFFDSNQPDLLTTFNCAAGVGTGSTEDPERPMEAMVDAVSGLGAAGACNADFLRDDAILVVTFITDEDDGTEDSAGSVETWRQALIDAKNGDETAIVVLGLFGDDDLPNNLCNGGAETSPRLRAFLDSWGGNGFFGSICADTYNAFFQEAVDIIDTTCDTFQPPG
jgi:hypothetical protein